MAKKKSKVMQWLPLVAILLGVVSVVMLFLPAVVRKDTDLEFSGWQTAFGYTDADSYVKVNFLNFSFILFIGVLAVIAGVVCSLLQVAMPKGNLFALIATACFVVFAVCCFLQVVFLAPGSLYTLDGYISAEKAKEGFELGIGSIIGGITGLCSAGVCAVSALKK